MLSAEINVERARKGLAAREDLWLIHNVLVANRKAAPIILGLPHHADRVQRLDWHAELTIPLARADRGQALRDAAEIDENSTVTGEIAVQSM